MEIENIFGSEYNSRRGVPVPFDTWDSAACRHMFAVFSFAYTPTGRVSKYWAAKWWRKWGKVYSEDRFVKVPAGLDRLIEEWKASRPALRPGYRWSEVYAY